MVAKHDSTVLVYKTSSIRYSQRSIYLQYLNRILEKISTHIVEATP